jgi:hypothetical protein
VNANSKTNFSKVTIVPLDWVQETLRVPVSLIDSVAIDDTKGSLKPEHFELWREHISKRDRDEMSATRIALLHRFSSRDHIGKDEQQSSDLMYKIFVALRIVKPTRTRFSAIQYKILNDGKIDVFSVTHPSVVAINAPDSESLNRVGTNDVVALQRILPAFLYATKNGPDHMQRAIRYHEAAYSQIHDPVIQFLTWVMGIEAVVARKDLLMRREPLLRRISELLDTRESIYQNSALNEFQKLPDLTIGAVLSDMFALRNRIAHGRGWDERTTEIVRTTLSGEKLNYASILAEAAPVVLRKLILASLSNVSPEIKS